MKKSRGKGEGFDPHKELEKIIAEGPTKVEERPKPGPAPEPVPAPETKPEPKSESEPKKERRHQPQKREERQEIESDFDLEPGDIIIPNIDLLNTIEVLGWTEKKGERLLKVQNTYFDKNDLGKTAVRTELSTLNLKDLSRLRSFPKSKVERHRGEVPRDLKKGDMVTIGHGDRKESFRIQSVKHDPDNKESGGGYFTVSRYIKGTEWSLPQEISFKDFYDKRPDSIHHIDKADLPDKKVFQSKDKTKEQEAVNLRPGGDFHIENQAYRFIASDKKGNEKGIRIRKVNADDSLGPVEFMALDQLPDKYKKSTSSKKTPSQPEQEEQPKPIEPPEAVKELVKEWTKDTPDKKLAVGQIITDRGGHSFRVLKIAKPKEDSPIEDAYFEIENIATGKKMGRNQRIPIKDYQRWLDGEVIHNIQNRKELKPELKEAKNKIEAGKVPLGLEVGDIIYTPKKRPVKVVKVVPQPGTNDPALKDGYVVLGFDPYTDPDTKEVTNKVYKEEIVPFYKLEAFKHNIELAKPEAMKREANPTPTPREKPAEDKKKAELARAEEIRKELKEERPKENPVTASHLEVDLARDLVSEIVPKMAEQKRGLISRTWRKIRSMW